MTSQVPSTAVPPTILVVDDERDVRESLSEVLADAGYAVVCAEHGVDALGQLARIPRPSAILLDLFMPEMNGWRLAEELKQRAELAQIPVIVVTATGPHWGHPAPRERVLRKPFQIAHLLRMLKDLVGAPAGST
jgi:CheY-like chemotaxis protein